jgi:hypothetical protein
VRLLALCLLCACAARGGGELDTPFSDAVAVPALAPSAVLDEGVGHGDPGVRGRALAWRIRTSSSPELGRWLMQGSYDPDPWAQALVVEAMVERLAEPAVREVLMGLCLRGSADPGVRARAASALVRGGHGAALGDVRGAWREQPGEQAAALAVVGLRLGEPDALTVVARALSRGWLGDDVPLLLWAVEGREPELVAALAEGVGRVEESTVLRYQFARAVAGDPAGLAAWRAALRDEDVDLQAEALELVLALPSEARSAWARQARVAGDRGVREAAASLARPAVDPILRALRADDPFAREVAMTAAAALPPASAAALIQRALGDEASEVRLRAADLAGRTALPELVPALTELLSDDHASVRVTAAGALLAIEARSASD